MDGDVLTLYRAERGEYIEKKSTFIADLRYAETEEAAAAHLAELRREFYDARHHCSAFVLSPVREGGLRAQPVLRSSDDGEPQGTAGHPMLDVLTGAGLINISAIVVRYFGGTLLGTGGLVRSYTRALQEAISASTLIVRRFGIPLSVTAGYGAAGKLDYFFSKEELSVLQKEYGEAVSCTVLVPPDRLPSVEKELQALTAGSVSLSAGEPVEYGLLDGTVLTGDALLS